MPRTSLVLLGLLATASPQIMPVAFAQDAPLEITTQPEVPVTPTALSLEQAIEAALERSPLLEAAASRARAATANRSQASALPNPEVSIEADNIFGDYDGLSNAEVTYGVSQLVELPGKRGNRVRSADAENAKAGFGRDAARLDLIRDVTVGFAEVVAAQQEVEILTEEYTLATEVRDSVAAKVKAGKEPPIQNNKAEIERSAREIALDRARRNLVAKKQSLSAMMGEGTQDFIVAEGTIPALVEPQPFETYRIRLIQTPDFKGFDADIDQAKAKLSFERASTVPDPTFNFGVKDLRGDDARAFVAGVSFPFPVFNVNRSGIERAGHELNAVIMDQRTAQLSSEAELNRIHSDFVSAFSEATALQRAVLPGAESAFDFARQGYEAGKFSYLEVLDAQRTLFDTRKQFSQAVLDYQRQRAVIDRMTAAYAEQSIFEEE